MTDQEKEQILTLRGQGQSYNSIATALHLSVNSIKTFCYRSRNRKALNFEDAPKTSDHNDLIDEQIRGNTASAKMPKGLDRPRVLGSQIACEVVVSFADKPDETAISDVLMMLENAHYGG